MGSPLSLKNTHTCLSGWMRDHWFNASMMDFINVFLPWSNHYYSDRGMGYRLDGCMNPILRLLQLHPWGEENCNKRKIG